MRSFEQYISQFPHYEPRFIEEVTPFLSKKKLETGEFFLREGKVCRQIAFVEKGLVRIYYLNDGHEITTCFCREGSITCSYKSLITHTPSDMSIQAVEPTELIVFSYDSLQQLYKKELFWQQVGRLAAENEFINTECHNRFITDMTATERYQQVLEDESDILRRVPLTILASYLQVAPETLSRIRKKISGT